jgi:hypothetical protein
VGGHKRRLVTDCLEASLVVLVTAAGVRDGHAAGQNLVQHRGPSAGLARHVLKV